MDRKTQISLGLFLGFEKDHDFFTGVEWDSLPESERTPAQSIAKADLFSLTQEGRSIFQYIETWKEIENVFSLVAANGERIVDYDMRVSLNIAAGNGLLPELFKPEHWMGQGDAMEDLWYRIDRDKRGSFDFDDVRRKVARAEGRTLREDQLALMGITRIEMQQAIKMGDLHTLKEKLEKHGDHLRVEDIQMPDVDGDHALYSALAWANFERTCQELKKHGEILDADFFLYRRGGKDSVISRAFDANQEGKVFGSMVFKGRPDECVKLYRALTDPQKAKINLSLILPDIIEKTYADMADIDDALSAARLTKTLYEPPADQPSWQPMFYLGMPKFINQIDKVNECLKKKGEKITLEMLRKPYGFAGETCLHRAARFGVFDKVMQILEENGEKLELADLMTKDAQGQHVVRILSQRNQLAAILKPEAWAGRIQSLTAIWSSLPLNEQSANKVSFATAQTRANQLSLRSLKR